MATTHGNKVQGFYLITKEQSDVLATQAAKSNIKVSQLVAQIIGLYTKKAKD